MADFIKRHHSFEYKSDNLVQIQPIKYDNIDSFVSLYNYDNIYDS